MGFHKVINIPFVTEKNLARLNSAVPGISNHLNILPNSSPEQVLNEAIRIFSPHVFINSEKIDVNRKLISYDAGTSEDIVKTTQKVWEGSHIVQNKDNREWVVYIWVDKY